jgi:hypothetical protein
MQNTGSDPIVQALIEVAKSPRTGFERLLSFGIPVQTTMLAFIFVVVTSTILSVLQVLVSPPPPNDPLAPLFNFVSASPFAYAAATASLQAALAFALAACGRPFGGAGTFAHALLLVTVLQLILIGLSIAQIVVTLILPALALLVVFIGFGYGAWLTVSMTAALHKLNSLGMALVVVLLAFVGLALSFSFVGTLFFPAL